MDWQLKTMAFLFAILVPIYVFVLPGKFREANERYESCINKGGYWVTLQDRVYVCAKLEIIQS